MTASSNSDEQDYIDIVANSYNTKASFQFYLVFFSFFVVFFKTVFIVGLSRIENTLVSAKTLKFSAFNGISSLFSCLFQFQLPGA